MERKKITCPKCRAVLEVSNPRNEPVLTIRCANPECGARLNVRFDTGETVLPQRPTNSLTPGYLAWNGQTFPLTEGRNVVGRRSKSVEADVAIATADKSVSRQHCLIEVLKTGNGRMKVVLSDMRTADKTAAAPLMLSGEAVAAGDRLVMENGDTVAVGSETLFYYQKQL